MSHFPELKTELEVLGSERNADLTGGKADALWIQVRATSDLLPSHVRSTVAHNPLLRHGGVVVVAYVVNPFAFV
jgi:hypothetical protein